MRGVCNRGKSLGPFGRSTPDRWRAKLDVKTAAFEGDAVRSLCRLIGILMLALWLPATQHCDLAAIGWLTGESHEEIHLGCDSVSKDCPDGCGLVEGGLYRLAGGAVLKAPALSPGLCDCLLYLQQALAEISAEGAGLEFGIDRTSDWLPRWHFARRAAPSPRAPSLNVA